MCPAVTAVVVVRLCSGRRLGRGQLLLHLGGQISEGSVHRRSFALTAACRLCVHSDVLLRGARIRSCRGGRSGCGGSGLARGCHRVRLGDKGCATARWCDGECLQRTVLTRRDKHTSGLPFTRARPCNACTLSSVYECFQQPVHFCVSLHDLP